MHVSIRFASGHIVKFVREGDEVVITLYDEEGAIISHCREPIDEFNRGMNLVS